MAIDTLGDGRIEPQDLTEEMRTSYLDYAMSVIVGRALPDVRDGLKPVHRRVLFSMNEAGLQPGRPYSKCSRVVGDVLGKYHPTAPRRRTTPSSAWPSRSRSGRRWSTARATSATSAATPLPPCAIR